MVLSFLVLLIGFFVIYLTRGNNEPSSQCIALQNDPFLYWGVILDSPLFKIGAAPFHFD